MSTVSEKLGNISPVYLAEFDELVKDLSQFGGQGSKGDKYLHSKAFSNAYEFYMYAFFIGLYRNTRLDILSEDKTTKFWEMNNWKPPKLMNFLLMCAIAESNFDMVGIEQMEENEVLSQIREVKQTIESYANGGLRLIQEKLDADPELAGNDMFFIRLLSESAE